MGNVFCITKGALSTSGVGSGERAPSARAAAHCWSQTVGSVDCMVHQAVPLLLLHLTHNHSYSEGTYNTFSLLTCLKLIIVLSFTL